MPPGLLEGRALLDGDPGLFLGDAGRLPGVAVGSGVRIGGTSAVSEKVGIGLSGSEGLPAAARQHTTQQDV